MRKTTILTAIFCLVLSVSAIFAQKAAEQTKTSSNFSGNWELDVSKSKLPERMKIEAMTMNVSQTDKDLKVESTTKRAMRTVDNAKIDATVNGAARRGAVMGGIDGAQTVIYSLEGKETKLETPGIPGADAKLRAELEKDGKLKLTTTRTFNGQTGEMTMTTTEIWELLDGGKTLKVTRETDTPRGAQTSEMIFAKK